MAVAGAGDGTNEGLLNPVANPLSWLLFAGGVSDGSNSGVAEAVGYAVCAVFWYCSAGFGASANSTVNVLPGPNPSGTIISFNRPSGA